MTDEGSPTGGEVASGGRWSLITTISKQLGRTLVTLVLAFFLTPDEFGIVTQATLYVALTAVFVDAGFSLAIIQRAKLLREDIASAFVLTATTAIGFGLLTLVVAGPVSVLFDSPEVRDVLRVLSLSVVLKGFALVPVALLVRRLDFRRLAIAELVATVVGGAVAIASAALGADYWAIVVQTLVHDALLLVIVFAFVGRLPLRPNRDTTIEIARFGTPVMGAQLMQYGGRNADNILIASALTNADLAFYGIGYRVVLLPQQLLMQSAGRVAVPVFARLAEERQRAARYFSDATGLLVMSVGLLMVMVFVTAPEGIPFILGDEWSPAGRPMQLLAIGGVLQVMPGFVNPALLGGGRTTTSFRLAFGTTLIFLAGFSLGLIWGIEGVATGFILANAVIVPIAFHLVREELGSTYRSLSIDLGIAASGLVASGVVGRVVVTVTDSLPTLISLGLGALAALVVVPVPVLALRRNAVNRWINAGRMIARGR
ncbi:MAG: lipopolysaccharide biosynthesis protein [Actinomycetota bacterium]